MAILKENIALTQTNEFHSFVLDIKERIKSSQLVASKAVNKELSDTLPPLNSKLL